MLILGLNAFHGDSAACLVRDGQLIAAAEEERFRRIKHWAGLPTEAVRYCLEEAGIRLSNVDAIAINQDTRANFWRKAAFAAGSGLSLHALLDRYQNKRKRLQVDAQLAHELNEPFVSGKLEAVEHHMSHLASAFLVSPFEKAVVVSVDGFGDFASAAWGIGHGTRIEVDGKIFFPHSIGVFYQALTQFIGFPNYGDEYKVMGLAPYGAPKHLAAMEEIVHLTNEGKFELNLRYFRHDKEKIEYEWSNGEPNVGRLYTPALEELLGPSRKKDDELTQFHKDLARSIQAMYEKAFFHLLNHLHSKYRLDNLALAGGCAMNSVANGKVFSNTPFKKLYIQSAAGDAGGAIGAAMAVWHRRAGSKGDFEMDHAYWGPHYSDAEVKQLLEEKSSAISEENCRVALVSNEDDLCTQTAAAIADGLVVGWFQGRMEWGPRALGNRSIVCDPRRADMKEILNRKIKRRESFRPFAPSILKEAVLDWFEVDDDVPFMMQVYQIRADRRGQIPAVTHVDGSGRLQTVYNTTNPRYYKLIQAFQAISGVPMLLNTSFNENEPVVCRPKEALDCFLRTKMDLLVMGSWMVRRG